MAVDLTIYYFYIRYFIDNIEDAGGGAFLWRSLVYCLFCLPLVMIPWATAWFYRFLVTSVEIEHGPPPAAA